MAFMEFLNTLTDHGYVDAASLLRDTDPKQIEEIKVRLKDGNCEIDKRIVALFREYIDNETVNGYSNDALDRLFEQFGENGLMFSGSRPGSICVYVICMHGDASRDLLKRMEQTGELQRKMEDIVNLMVASHERILLTVEVKNSTEFGSKDIKCYAHEDDLCEGESLDSERILCLDHAEEKDYQALRELVSTRPFQGSMISIKRIPRTRTIQVGPNGKYENPKLDRVRDIIRNYYRDKPGALGIILCKTRDMCVALTNWMKVTEGLWDLNPHNFVEMNMLSNRARMAQLKQEDLLKYVNDCHHKIIIATSLAEDGTTKIGFHCFSGKDFSVLN